MASDYHHHHTSHFDILNIYAANSFPMHCFLSFFFFFLIVHMELFAFFDKNSTVNDHLDESMSKKIGSKLVLLKAIH